MTAPRATEIKNSYDRLAAPYAEHLNDELAGKPLDRQLLDRFAEAVRGTGLAADVGCGPGHVGRYLHDRGVEICGIDLSPGMLEQARRLHPGLQFQQGDLCALAQPDGAFAGIVAFYSIVHLAPAELPRALRELRRVLRPGGPLLLAFHVGEELVHPGELWGVQVPLDWFFFRTAEVAAKLRAAGFSQLEIIERPPYEGVEHPSTRAYIFSH